MHIRRERYAAVTFALDAANVHFAFKFVNELAPKFAINCAGLKALAFLLAGCGGESPDDAVTSTANIPLRSSAATTVGDPTGDITSATIGTAGGTLRTPGGEIVLVIPSGALTSDTTIAIEPLVNTASGGLGSSYRLTPDGQIFEHQIQVTIPYGDLELAGTPPQALGIATQTADGYWQLLDNAVVDQEDETVTVATAHLSDYSLVEGFQIWPYFRQVNAGERIAITVIYCYRREEVKYSPVPESNDDDRAPLVPPEHDDDLAPLGELVTRIRCDMEDDQDPLLPIPDVLAWKVNGVEGGNRNVGMVAKQNRVSANYTAPSESPDPDTVTVSADLPWGDKGKQVATAQIRIAEPGRTYEGSLRYSSVSPGRSVTLSGDVTWIEGESGADSFLAAGTMQLTISTECSRIDNNGRLQTGEAKFGGAVRFQGEMSFHVPADARYTFAVGTNSDDAPLVCNEIVLPYAVLFTSMPCDASLQYELGDGRLLKGSNNCGDGQHLEWNFAQTR